VLETYSKNNWQLPSYSQQEFSNKTCQYAIVLITWNEGNKLKKQLDDLQDYLSQVDVIIVDGGSNDGSTEIEYLKSKNIRTLLNCNEIGIGKALRVGLAYSVEENYKGILTIDCNGKDGVAAIPLIIEKLEQGFDLVQASRFMKGGIHKNTPIFRRLGIHLMIIPSLFMGCGFWFTDPTNGFKGLSRNYLLDERVQPFRDVFERFNMQFYLNYCAPRHRLKVVEVPASRTYPDDGSVPTKIHGISSHLRIIYEIIKTCIGGYNPRK
jgi:dolichol-phosphate mannosyltransferase